MGPHICSCGIIPNNVVACLLIVFGIIYLCMTKSLEKAFEALNKLSKEEQNEFARLIIDDIEWNQKLSATKDSLQLLAEEALVEYNND